MKSIYTTIKRCISLYLVIGLALFINSIAQAQCNPREINKLLAPGFVKGNMFGYSIAISSDTGKEIAIIGAIHNNSNGIQSGLAYLLDINTGKQIAQLTPSDDENHDDFGISVAICGNTAIVGAYRDDDNGIDSGSAYLFDITTGMLIAKLLPNDGARSDRFGNSVAITGTTAIVASWEDSVGAVYIFNTTTGEQLYKLLATDGASGDLFGYSLAVSGNTAIICAPGDDDNGSGSGSVYLFDITAGQQITKLLSSDGEAGDAFGFSVAVSGTTAIIGAPGDSDYGSKSGSAYIFDITTGEQITRITGRDLTAFDHFGYSVAINNNTAIVGTPDDDDNGNSSGSAYLFDITTGRQIAKILPNDGAYEDQFGWATSMGTDMAIVSALYGDHNGYNPGSVYVVELNCDSENVATLTDFLIQTGVLLDGAIDDLINSDDSYIHIRSGFGQTVVDLHNMEMIVNAVTTFDSPTFINLTIESRIDEPAGLAQIRLRNWNTNQFQSVGSYSLGNTDNIDAINNINATNYVDGAGNIDLSIKHLVFVPFLAFTFESFIDHVQIFVE